MPILNLLLGADTISRGVSIAVTGMLIVACALLLICLFIASLPKVLTLLATVWPESDDELHSDERHPEDVVPDEDAILAAIGYVLHLRAQGALPGSSTAKKKN